MITRAARTVILFDGQNDRRISEMIPEKWLNKTYSYSKLVDGEPTERTAEKREYFKYDGREGMYSPRFVGYLRIGECLFVSLPKYVFGLHTSYGDGAVPEEGWLDIYHKKYEFSLFRLFEKYKSYLRDNDDLFLECFRNGDNRFEIASRIIGQYLAGGIYMPSQNITDHKGRTVWGQTVKRVKPSFIDGTPLYMETIKKRNVRVENDVSEIHKAAVAYAYRKLGIRERDLPASQYSFDAIIASPDSYKRALRRERNIVNKDIDVQTIQLLIRFIDGERADMTPRDDIYAVANFETLFEKLVGDYFGNKLDRNMLARINSCQTISWTFDPVTDENGEVLEVRRPSDYTRPYEHATETYEREGRIYNDTSYLFAGRIIPDVLFKDGEPDDPDAQYYILDAKYRIVSEDNYVAAGDGAIKYLRNLPGISDDILKQYYYADVVKNMAKCEEPRNVFVLPRAKKGSGTMEIIGHSQKDEQRIYLMFLDTDRVIQDIVLRRNYVSEHRNTLKEEIEKYNQKEEPAGERADIPR